MNRLEGIRRIPRKKNPENIPEAVITPTRHSDSENIAKVGDDDSVARKGSKPLVSDTTEDLVTKIVEQKLDTASHKLREDFLTIFGLFAAFLAFIVIEVQVFIQVHRFSLLMGFSSFFLAALILFVLALHNVAKGRNGWLDFIRPIFWLIVGLMFFAFECFWYATHHNHLWHV